MEDNQTRIMRYSTINFIGWVVSIGVTLLSIPFFISRISSEGYGVWVLISSLTGYFSLLQFGIGPAIIKYVSQYKFQKDLTSVRDTINAALLFSLFVGTIGGMAIYVLSPFFASIFHLPDRLYEQSLTSFRIGALFYPAFLVSNVYVSVFIGYQQYVISNILNTIQIALTALIGSLFLVFDYGIVGLVAASAIVDIVCILLGQYLLHRMIDRYELRPSGAFSALKTIFGYSMYTFISQMAQILNARLPEIIIGIALGPGAVTLFNIPARLVGYFSSGASSMSAVLFPFASELQASADRERIKRTFLKAVRHFTFLIVPFYFFVIVYSRPILGLWLSSEIADKGYQLMALYSLAYLIANMTTIPSQYLQGFGKVKLISRFSVGVLVVSVLAYYPLTWQLGILGSGIAMLMTQAFGLLFIHYSLRVLVVSLPEYISANARPFLFGFLALLLSLLFGYLIREVNSSYLLSFLVSFLVFSGFYYLLCMSFSEIGDTARKFYFSLVRR
jgi:O-antigen/teichoic acid export membrane protein